MPARHTLGPPPAADDPRYLALAARDARFDGRFFTGVTSTGVYCRPVCRVRTPRRENCRFFDHVAQAEAAGFRPCLRCRPELAPAAPALLQAPPSLAWSTQDAAATLAHQAARLLDEADGAMPSMAALAERLGVSDRHLRRIFERHLGVSPLQYLQTRRLLRAKQMLADTTLPVAEVALAAGFDSVRRFNAAFAGQYGLNPMALRAAQGQPPASAPIEVRLGYRPPYDVAGLLAFFRVRCIAGIETVAEGMDGEPGTGQVARTVRLRQRDGSELRGWLCGRFDDRRHTLHLQVADSLRPALPLVIRRLRAALDLDADPLAIDAVLGADFPGQAGQRVPGALDGFELAVRAILGQQVTVAAARTLAQRLVDRLGEPIATPWPALHRLFPSPQTLAATDPAVLGGLGIVRQRQQAIGALAQAVASGALDLDGETAGTDTVQRLRALPGVGDWTAQYIAMRALRWPDAFPAGDVALQRALGLPRELRGVRAAREAEALSRRWRPWRSYAVLRAWNAPPATKPATEEPS